ncbi:hypothetical protein [Streptomyces sp. NPDC006925]|uniref:hypothetical protein n=1 Tax=Streptomyces sp. NPDC006925 TaxID=3364768 RepID=UPI0036CD3413
MSLRYFNQTGWTAIFDGTDTEIGRMVRVEGWDRVTGTALVVDPSVVDHPLKDLGELAAPNQSGDHGCHAVDAGIPDDQIVRDPEVSSPEGLVGPCPELHQALESQMT